MTQVTLHEGDNRETLRRLIDQGVRVHSVVTDPPYGLTSITKRFGKDGAAPAKFGSDGAFSRASAGFMGSKWDGTGIERDPEFWRLIHDILLPGGYVVAFSGSRTGHWQACAMEMAGFIMHPFLGWVYGSGMPKDHDAAKAIDRQLGSPGEIVPVGDPVKRLIPGSQQNATGDWIKTDARTYQPGEYVPGSPEAAQWYGWGYGGQALKPALEPIFVGQKPFSEKNGALNLLRHSVGAINIDGCRVSYENDAPNPATNPLYRIQNGYATEVGSDADGSSYSVKPNGGQITANALGRHPANLLHDGSDEVVALFPQSAGQQAAVRGTEKSRTGDENTNCYGEYGRIATPVRGDTGSAARFFNAFAFTDPETVMRDLGGTYAEAVEFLEYLEQHRPIAEDAPVKYVPKATKADRAGSRHPTVKPVALMQWLVRLVTPAGGTVLDPFAGSGTTGEAARREGFGCVLMEAEAQFATDIRTRFGLAADDFDCLMTPVSNLFPTGSESVTSRTHSERVGDDFDALMNV